MWLWVVLLLCLTGCSRMSDNAELIDIAGMVSEHPAEALGRLGAINRDSLPERDAYYHDFLTLKANDKAYIDHTTDSIILRLLPYYEGEPLYPEVLYYAGRVYSDLGDYPTSLRYFQEALDHIPADKEHLRLKGHICSQTGRLLNTLRMYDSAIPYIKTVIKTNRQLKDTINLAYNNQLLSALYIHKNLLDSAEMYINQAYKYAIGLSDGELADMILYQAIVQYKKNNTDSELMLVRSLPYRVDPISRNMTLINAADIYEANGIIDTAYMYADELIHSSDINNLKNGYRKLLSNDIIDLVPKDSLIDYVKRYSAELDRYYDFNNSQQSIVQESTYNYQLHDRERAKAEDRNTRLIILLVIAVIVILLISTSVLYYRNRRKALLLKLNETINELNAVRTSIEDKEGITNKIAFVKYSAGDINSLRQHIKEQLEYIASHEESIVPDSGLLNSEAYRRAEDYLKRDTSISENSDLWEELEKEILRCSPYFKKRLQTLSDYKLAPYEYHLALLIKCGFTPTNMITLLSRTKGTISYRRRHLLKLIFGEEIETSQLDNIIRCL